MKPKLFVDAHVFDGFYQGSRTFIKGLYSAMPPGEAELFLGACDTECLHHEFPGVPRDHLLRYRSHSAVARLLWEVPALIRQHHIDFAHFQYMAPPRKSCAYVVTTHDLLFRDLGKLFPPPYRLARNALFRRSLRTAEIRTAPSRYSRDRIAFHYGIPADTVHIVPGGVADSFFSPHWTREASSGYLRERYGLGDYLLCVSRIEPRKNQLLLLDAYHALGLHRQGLSLVYIGKTAWGGEEFASACRLLEPEVRRHILHLEQVPDEELPHFYKAATLMVYPSLGEGFGIPPLEAAAMGTPVCCSAATALGAFEALGIPLFDPADVAGFREKLRYLIEHRPSEGTLAAVADRVRRTYRWEQAAEKLLACLHRVQSGQMA